jgi:hypothetical protein
LQPVGFLQSRCWKFSDFSKDQKPGGNTMAIKHFGSMAVDWEQRIDFDRLRKERLARAKMLLERSEMGALLCFDMNNVRYLTATHIGTWAQDKISRRCCRRMTSPFCGTLARPRGIISKIVRGSEIGPVLAFRCCVGR